MGNRKRPDRAKLNLEAPPGFEPGMEVLQSGSGSISDVAKTSESNVLLEKSRTFVFTTDTRNTGNSSAIGTIQGQGHSQDALPFEDRVTFPNGDRMPIDPKRRASDKTSALIRMVEMQGDEQRIRVSPMDSEFAGLAPTTWRELEDDGRAGLHRRAEGGHNRHTPRL
jgi:hypothetical protein